MSTYRSARSDISNATTAATVPTNLFMTSANNLIFQTQKPAATGVKSPIIVRMNYAQAAKRTLGSIPANVGARVSASAGPTALIIPPSVWTTMRDRSDSCAMSDASESDHSSSSPSSPTSSISNVSMDSIHLAVDQLLRGSKVSLPSLKEEGEEKEEAVLSTSGATISESKRRACRKKNHKRREAAKKNRALLSSAANVFEQAQSTGTPAQPIAIVPKATGSLLATAPVYDTPTATAEEVHTMPHSPSTAAPLPLTTASQDSPNAMSEATFSTADGATDPNTPTTTAFDSDLEQDHQQHDKDGSQALKERDLETLQAEEQTLEHLHQAKEHEEEDEEEGAENVAETQESESLPESTLMQPTSVHLDNSVEKTALTHETVTQEYPLSETLSSEPIALPEENVRAAEAREESDSPIAVDRTQQSTSSAEQQDDKSRLQEEHEPAEPETCSVATVEDKAQHDNDEKQFPSSDASPSLADKVVDNEAHLERTSEPGGGAVAATLAADSIPTLSSWDVASEHVATVALQCLSRDKDMELSYVAILSAITVLQSQQDQSPGQLQEDPSAQVHRFIQDSRDKVARTYSQIMQIMCKSTVGEALGKEIIRQRVMSSEALYSQFYGSIQQAGYNLEDGAHLSMAQYWSERKKIEEAQECLGRIDPSRWNAPIYREAIACLLLSKPRQLQEAEVLLQKYIDHNQLAQPQSAEEETKIRTWFKLQGDASKWEDVKAQYERRRTRLVDGPSTNDHKELNSDVESRLTPQALQQHQLQQQQTSPQRQQPKHERSKSIASSTTSSSHIRSASAYTSTVSGHQRTPSGQGHQRTPSVATAWPSGASASLNVTAPSAATPPPTAPAKGTFSFLSSLKFTKSTNAETSTTTALPSRLNVNRHLTVLDNGMLEECVKYKEFEYGWKQIYEKMGSALEDGDTAKIAMRLCRRAFLGHGGLDPNHPGSTNLVARDIHFADEIMSDEEQEPVSVASLSLSKHDPEIWEARAWAIYNKAMMNPHTFLSSSSGTGAHASSSSAAPAAAADGGSVQSASGALAISTSAGTTAMSMFLHDILTIAIHSPEISSRYLKAFKVYSAIRSDTQNQHQLRDPFVMSCMIKAIYDAALAVVHNPDQKFTPASVLEKKAEAVMKHDRRSSSLSLNRSQPMTLGPLMDLAFEIYADMRSVGPIRHLPSLISLTPSSPTGKGPKGGSHALPVPSAVAESKSNSSPTSSMVELSETDTTSTISISPRASFAALSMSVFQELNPTLKPSPQARRLPAELYLALLHLSIQVPVYRISSQVVKTIVDDMASEGSRDLQNVDYQLAAALQCYHDSWMACLGSESDSSVQEKGQREDQKKCVYYEWMYKSDEAVEEHIAAARRLSAVSDMSSNGSEAKIPIEGLEEPKMAVEGEEQATCNDRFYWDLWSSEDAALKDVRFSKVKAKMLWKHVTQELL